MEAAEAVAGEVEVEAAEVVSADMQLPPFASLRYILINIITKFNSTQ